MNAPHENAIAPHAQRPKRKWPARVALAILAILIVRWIDIEFLGHWEVRLDSGDLRRSGRVFVSIPDRLKSADRALLMAASSELGIPAEWHRALPSAPSNGDYGNRVHLYTRTAFWLREEPGLGKIILSQATEYTRRPRDETGQPAALAFLWYVRWDWEQDRYAIDTERMERDEHLAKQLAEIGYTPRPGGTLAKYAEQSGHMFDGYAQVVVDSITSEGGSKYHWQHAHVVRVVQCDSRWTIGSTIDFAHINTMGDVPDGQQLLYLEHFDGPPQWWRLFKYEPQP